MFWSIYFVDRELIYPKYLDAIFPSYINHIQHTLPGIFAILELILVNHQYHVGSNSSNNVKKADNNNSNTSSKQSITTTKTTTTTVVTTTIELPSTSNLKQDVINVVLFNLFYLSILVLSRVQLGYWVYDVIETIPDHSKVIFIFSSSCYFVSIYAIGRFFSQRLYGGKSVWVINKESLRRSMSNPNTPVNANKIKVT
ncbi:hypothetical protein DLAC_11750 [Tieghemostelium lacteum]|uniref:Uncharacterized protein n=1 Tax=Tieghemostelium lacteum TaxID=361077 RepID=A0A151Z8J2_TIELA|nr:hypothetical protein DLAC_11750 [Tieghemostelium lacteum]|eukprot:KYQ90289.1 hypothetical protein DLAC_11750 [Tieghemostelium lacteum]